MPVKDPKTWHKLLQRLLITEMWSLSLRSMNPMQ
jgi:hypothetical protein